MDRPQPQKIEVNIDLDHDYISNLPADLKDYILVKLSLKEAVRTSILSSKWIDSWTSIPNLVFEENFTGSELIKLVDNVLLVHQGSIQKFKLVSWHAYCDEAIGRWMLILSRNGIRDLELIFQYDNRCNIPFRLISCLALERVDLSNCIINVPRVFNGFTLLHTLHLSYFNLSGFGIEKLVASCPLLEHLKLLFFVLQGCLRILAPNLTSLVIYGEFHGIYLETPKLASGHIYLHLETHRDYLKSSAKKDGKESNITRALGRLSNIQKLGINAKFFEYLAMGPIPENLPAVFNHLTEFFVVLRIFPDEIATFLYLLQNAPNLKVLDIEFWDCVEIPHVEAMWESKAIQDCLFKHLEVVNMMNMIFTKLSFRRAKSILEFAKLVLSTAPLLGKFNVIGLKDTMVLFEMLEFFPRLSKKAKIVFLM